MKINNQLGIKVQKDDNKPTTVYNTDFQWPKQFQKVSNCLWTKWSKKILILFNTYVFFKSYFDRVGFIFPFIY